MALTVTHALVSAIADDPVAAAAGEVVPSDWNADHTITVTSLTIATGTITASEPVLDLSQTWNAAGVTFTGWELTITNTACADGSKLWNIKQGSVSVLSLIRDTSSTWTPALVVTSTTNTAKQCVIDPQNNSFTVYYNASPRVAYQDSGIKFCNYADGFSWSSSGTHCQSTKDTGLHKSAAGIVEVNNGTTGTFRDLKLRNLLAGGGNGSYVQTPSMTVTNLAAAATAGAGARAFVTDATATTFLSTVAGGGANKVPVVSDGTNWLIG